MRVLLHGADGHMGQEVQRLLAKGYAGGVLAAAVDERSQREGTLHRLIDFSGEADVLIDFSYHTCTPAVAAYAVAMGMPAVLATTGQSGEEMAALRSAAEHVPVFFSANLSLGVALLTDLVRKASVLMQDADVEIVEVHHRHKADAPSGTALALAGAVREARPELRNRCGREGQCPRTQEEIGIHSLRMGNAAGEHTVVFSTPTQTLYLGHKAHSRALYAEGALRAAAFLMAQKPGLYSMKEMLR